MGRLFTLFTVVFALAGLLLETGRYAQQERTAGGRNRVDGIDRDGGAGDELRRAAGGSGWAWGKHRARWDLHDAMYVIPALAVVLAGVLWMAGRRQGVE